jgi:hypothetical protein
MRCLVSLTGNAILGALAGFGMAEAAAVYGLEPLIFVCTGLISGGLACAAACL